MFKYRKFKDLTIIKDLIKAHADNEENKFKLTYLDYLKSHIESELDFNKTNRYLEYQLVKFSLYVLDKIPEETKSNLNIKETKSYIENIIDIVTERNYEKRPSLEFIKTLKFGKTIQLNSYNKCIKCLQKLINTEENKELRELFYFLGGNMDAFELWDSTIDYLTFVEMLGCIYDTFPRLLFLPVKFRFEDFVEEISILFLSDEMILKIFTSIGSEVSSEISSEASSEASSEPNSAATSPEPSSKKTKIESKKRRSMRIIPKIVNPPNVDSISSKLGKKGEPLTKEGKQFIEEVVRQHHNIGKEAKLTHEMINNTHKTLDKEIEFANKYKKK